MKERPILFSGPMVRAILDGRKRMTRRTSGLEKINLEPDAWTLVANKGGGKWLFRRTDSCTFATVSCPYGTPGDRLWVRETFTTIQEVNDGRPLYRATDWDGCLEYEVEKIRWRPSIYMPRRASRITLEVTGVRVERLQEISERDAEREGVYRIPAGTDEDGFHYDASDYRSAFVQLWDSINGRGVRKIIGDGTVQTHNKKHREEKPDVSWAANPWVWVVEFMRVDQA